MLKKCNKLNCEDCFARNLNGYCIALRDIPDGKCIFYKNKYDMKKERLSYDSESTYNYLVKSGIYIDCIIDIEKGV